MALLPPALPPAQQTLSFGGIDPFTLSLPLFSCLPKKILDNNNALHHIPAITQCVIPVSHHHDSY
jgi:hypothetical protein